MYDTSACTLLCADARVNLVRPGLVGGHPVRNKNNRCVESDCGDEPPARQPVARSVENAAATGSATGVNG